MFVRKPLYYPCVQITTLFWHRWTLGNYNRISCIFKTIQEILGVHKLRLLEDSGVKLLSFPWFCFS